MNSSLKRGVYRALSPSERLKYPAYKYVIVAPYVYKFYDRTITVPRGFLTDGASTPLGTGLFDIGSSWIIHDWLYAKQRYDDRFYCPQEEADQIMFDILQLERHFIYSYVYKWTNYVFNYKFRQAYVSSGMRGPEFKFLV